MAKSSKLEDYWRQHNIENLFKDLTHALAQRMPADPVAAIVQHLQKKFPKSFKTPADNIDVSTLSKTSTTNLQLQPGLFARSPMNLLNTSEIETRNRRASTQSQTDNILNIPTSGSAFRSLLDQSTSGVQEVPEVTLKTLTFPDRFGKQAIKLGRKVQSDRDILEEELIKPLKTTSSNAPRPITSADTISENLQQTQTSDQSSLAQIIAYKQKVNEENNRRLHREHLADLAKKANEAEKAFESNIPKVLDSSQYQLPHQHELSATDSDRTNVALVKKPIAGSKEEEEILNDEMSFRARRDRNRDRNRNKGLRSRPTTPTMRAGICKACGNPINNRYLTNTSSLQQVPDATTMLTTHTLALPTFPRSTASSAADIDDFFGLTTNASLQQQASSSSSVQEDITPQDIGSSRLQQFNFRPIQDTDTRNMESRLPPTATKTTKDEARSQQTRTSSRADFDIFSRSPELKEGRSSSARSTSSPVAKKRQTASPDVTDQQSPRAMTAPSPLRRILESTLSATACPTTERRMSAWSVGEHSADDSDDN